MIPPAEYGQNAQILLNGLADLSGPGGGLPGGFTLGGLIGGLVFGAVGFVAFVYGKKNAEFKPLILGVLLMAYPLFIRSTAVLYVLGIVLTAAVFFWRD
ncbi:MAG: hypothetical protein ACM3L6_02040 [Deltaproteobacteria bacterium]